MSEYRKYITHYPKKLLPDLNAHSLKHIFPINRFHNNPHAKHILTDDIYNCQIGPDGELIYKIFSVKTNSIPLIFQRYWPNCPIRIAFVEEIKLQYGGFFRQKYGSDQISQLSRNLQFRDILTVHEKAIYSLDEVSNQVEVDKTFLCKSYKPGTIGYGLRQFGFWRYHNNIKLSDQGLSLKCLEFENRIKLENTKKEQATLITGRDRLQNLSNAEIEKISKKSPSVKGAHGREGLSET